MSDIADIVEVDSWHRKKVCVQRPVNLAGSKFWAVETGGQKKSLMGLARATVAKAQRTARLFNIWDKSGGLLRETGKRAIRQFDEEKRKIF